MSPFLWRSRARTESSSRPRPRDTSQGQVVWLPGRVEVQVAGESFHEDAIAAVDESRPPGSLLDAVLVPEPDNPHDSNAVAVYINSEHVGFLPRETAQRVQAAIIEFSKTHGGRLVSCPAEIRWHDIGPQVLLLLDPTPLGLPSKAFETIPGMAATIMCLLARLDEPPPIINGCEQSARMELEKKDQERQEIDADYSRDPDDLPRVEHALRRVAKRLAKASDPCASAAWLSVARATRYQGGRRDDTLSALIEALYWDRGDADAWSELVDFASAAPHVPMLLALFARMPPESRAAVLSQLLCISEGRDRLGRMPAAAGDRLRDGLLDIAESEGDRATIAALTGYAGLAAEKVGDLDIAVRYWRRAIASGSTDAKVADRFSAWLVNEHEYLEATAVLQHALMANPGSANTAKRLQRRLTRCMEPHTRASRPSQSRAFAAAPVELETLVCAECGQSFRRCRTRGRKPRRCPTCAKSQVAVR